MSVKPSAAGRDLFAVITQSPAAVAFRQRMETGGVLSCAHVANAAQPFFAVLLRRLFPRRPIVVVTEGLKTQETFHQDIQTWLRLNEGSDAERSKSNAYFYPAWETLPHESKLPHADVIGERLETLVALTAATHRASTDGSADAPLVITSVPALLQRTFPPESLSARTRQLNKGDRLDPLDLVEWLEEQGYEPEAQVNHRGEIALRGGIVDIFPLTSPWPVRVEFFGDEIESLRTFDPISQISREAIGGVTIPPGGELALLKVHPPGAGGGVSPGESMPRLLHPDPDSEP